MLEGLKVVLLKRGITQRSLARLVKISPWRLSRVVQEHVRPRARERRLIAEHLSVREREIFPPRRARTRRRAPNSPAASCELSADVACERDAAKKVGTASDEN